MANCFAELVAYSYNQSSSGEGLDTLGVVADIALRTYVTCRENFGRGVSTELVAYRHNQSCMKW